jgi:hypothetical protein
MSTDETFAADGGRSRGGLRARAERAWAERQRAEAEGPRSAQKSRSGCLQRSSSSSVPRRSPFRIIRAGTRVSAEVEGLRFASIYSDPTLRKLGFDDEPEKHGVIILKSCPRCGREVKGGVIRTPEELGRELEQLPAIRVHRCQVRAGPEGPEYDHTARGE